MVRREDREREMFMVLNSGSIRFDIFKGPFTRNDQVRSSVGLVRLVLNAKLTNV